MHRCWIGPRAQNSQSPVKPKVGAGTGRNKPIADSNSRHQAEYDRAAALVFPWPGPQNPQQANVKVPCHGRMTSAPYQLATFLAASPIHGIVPGLNCCRCCARSNTPGAAAGRGGGADILGRRFRSEALATSRDICCWLALSCSMLALSCSTSCPRLATSRAIDCSNCADSADGAAAAGATPCGAV